MIYTTSRTLVLCIFFIVLRSQSMYAYAGLTSQSMHSTLEYAQYGSMCICILATHTLVVPVVLVNIYVLKDNIWSFFGNHESGRRKITRCTPQILKYTYITTRILIIVCILCICVVNLRAAPTSRSCASYYKNIYT